jgi:hypothetical protein
LFGPEEFHGNKAVVIPASQAMNEPLEAALIDGVTLLFRVQGNRVQVHPAKDFSDLFFICCHEYVKAQAVTQKAPLRRRFAPLGLV